MKTLIVWLVNPITGVREGLRVLLDSGSSHSFIALEWITKLELRQLGNRNVNIKTFDRDSNKQVAIEVEAQVCNNRETSESMVMKFLCVDKFVNDVACFDLTTEQKERLDSCNFDLADPEADSNGKLPIDILIGQDYYHALQDREELSFPGGLILTKGKDGKYILSGTSVVECHKENCLPNSEMSNSAPSYHTFVDPFNFGVLSPEIEQVTLDRFNSLDALGITNIDKEKSPIDEKFDKTTILKNGRYCVELPLKETHYLQLETNFPMAFNRFASWINKHKKKSDKTAYDTISKIMKEQLELGILEEVTPLGTIEEVRKELGDDLHVYDKVAVKPGSKFTHVLPWHATIKKSTGKCRVVYDAAAKANKWALALNDVLETGPVSDKMNPLFQILLGFRKHRYACKADIEKAFLQVEIAEEYRDALRMLWIKDGIVWILRFARLPFGLTCSPYILAAVLEKHLNSSTVDKQLVHQILAAFYVDDNIWSVKTHEELLQRSDITLKEFLKAGMKLRQWNSNSDEAREIFRKQGDDTPDKEMILGLKWDVRTDLVSINADRISSLIGKQPKTKRQFWSFVAQVYDPLGFLAPYTTLAKLLTREVSAVCKGWDSKLPQDLSEKVARWMEDFALVPTLTFPRHVGMNAAKLQQLVCFCDASQQALGAAIYLRSTDMEGEVVVNLITSKSRIAPSPTQTIPRLELTAAVLGVNLMSHVQKTYPEISKENTYYFSDSRNVVFWIHNGSRSVPTYVANRLDTIFKHTEAPQWIHVDTEENSGDLPSRGCSMEELIQSKLWKEGPEFLKRGIHCGKSTVDGYKLAERGLGKQETPEGCIQEMEAYQFLVDLAESRCTISEKAQVLCSLVDIEKCCTYDKLIGAIVHAVYFIKKCAKAARKPLEGIANNIDLESDLRRQVEVAWIQVTQRKHYPDLFKLTANPEMRVSQAMKGFFKDHGVFLDKDLNVLRVTTRLQESLHPYDAVYPILLPPKSRFTTLYIRKVHVDNGHAGIPQTLSYVRSEMWVPQGRSEVKYVLRRCNPCRRVSGPFYAAPKHPPIPKFRVQRSRCFKNVGLDFIGPIDINDQKYEQWRILTEKQKKKRRVTRSSYKEKKKPPPKEKAYILIFTCAVSRMVHLEATFGMTVHDFMLGFQRFMNFRGVPEFINSDNAKTFIRSHKEFESIYKSSRVRKMFDQKRIKWHFYTERAPWMGGYIERLNAILKSVCKKVYGKALLSFDEFRSMVTDAMGVVNDRPLTYVYSDFNSAGTDISPSMLCYGHKLRVPPDLSFRKTKTESEMTMGERYVHLEKVKDSFWKAWYEEYLTMLMERHIKQGKVPIKFRVPKVDDMVIVRNENTPRRTWKLGRVLRVKMGARDQAVREVQVLTTNKSGKRTLLNRSPTFLVPLEVGTEYMETPKPTEDREPEQVEDKGEHITTKGSLVTKTRFQEDIKEPSEKKQPLPKGSVVLRRSCRKGRRALCELGA